MAAAAASDLESKAKEAFVDDDFELAAELYTQAIEAGPATAELYADRAQAHIKLGSYTEAVADANKAIELDPSMHKAYYRKGAACIKLEEYQTAKAALELGSSYASGDARFARLIKECDDRIAEEASQVPAKKATAVVPAATSGATTVATPAEDKEDGANMENSLPNVEVPSKPKYRHDFYNSTTEVVLTIFAKGVPADTVVVDFGEQMLSVSIELPGEEPYHFQPRLFAKSLWRQASGILCDKRVPQKLKGKFYRTAIRPAILYGAECWPTKRRHVQQLGVAEMRMLRWMCGHTRRDRVRNDDIRDRVGVAPIAEKLVQHRLRWFGHIQRRPLDAPVHSGRLKRAGNVKRGQGRPNLTWEESVKRDLKGWNITKELAMNRAAWKLAIHVPEP